MILSYATRKKIFALPRKKLVTLGAMPRPTPPPEDEKQRPSLSLPRKIVEAGKAYRALHPEEHIRDFSDLMGRALLAYALAKHPDLLDKTVEKIRAETVTAPLKKPHTDGQKRKSA